MSTGRILRLSALVLAAAIAAPAVDAGLRVASAQERSESPRGRGTCSFCGAARDADKPDAPCAFCGARESVYPQKRTETPTGGPAKKPVADFPHPTSGAPASEPPAPPPSDPKPVKDVEPADPEEGTDAKARAYRDENVAKGDYYFKTGYYLKASEAYRVAVLEEPVNPWKKLSFGHALFAIGNYSYASYALRRAVSQLDQKEPFNPDVASLFPSKKAFEKALRDLKRYVTYSPRDPAGLSVLGYVLYAEGEHERAREMFEYLQKLPKNESDPFAAFFVKQMDQKKGKKEAPAPEPKKAPEPAKGIDQKTEALVAPEAARQDEEPARIKPVQGAALAE